MAVPSDGTSATATQSIDILNLDTLPSPSLPVQKPFSGMQSLQSFFSLLYNNTSFLPGYRCGVDLHSFALHKNEFFKRQYLAATDISMEADFFEINDKLTFSAFAGIGFGLGEVKGNLVFTLLNTYANLSLISRYRFTDFTTWISINHTCFHDIDSGLFPVIYFNTFHLGLSTDQFQESDFWRKMYQDNGWILFRERAWNIEISYFIKEFFGLVRKSKLNGYNDRTCQVDNFTRFAIFKWNALGVALTTSELLGFAAPPSDDKKNYLYWRFTCTGELHLSGNGESMTLYVGYGFDDMPRVIDLPRFSKDRLLQFGIRIMN